ncbi:hypothetical protein C8F01DRAFT_1112383 [Mycena amicta]|nr:hypothetical protein C8F01DRAFT_1112383 [Mycena amicta]
MPTHCHSSSSSSARPEQVQTLAAKSPRTDGTMSDCETRSTDSEDENHDETYYLATGDASLCLDGVVFKVCMHSSGRSYTFTRKHRSTKRSSRATPIAMRPPPTASFSKGPQRTFVRSACSNADPTRSTCRPPPTSDTSMSLVYSVSHPLLSGTISTNFEPGHWTSSSGFVLTGSTLRESGPATWTRMGAVVKRLLDNMDIELESDESESVSPRGTGSDSDGEWVDFEAIMDGPPMDLFSVFTTLHTRKNVWATKWQSEATTRLMLELRTLRGVGDQRPGQGLGDSIATPVANTTYVKNVFEDRRRFQAGPRQWRCVDAGLRAQGCN